MQIKHCRFCKTILTTCMFNRNRRNSDGHQSYCKLCHRAVVNIWQLLNTERKRAKNRRYSKANLHKEREWSRKKRARKRDQLGWMPYNAEQLLRDFQNNKCWFCEIDISTISFHQDHLTPLSKGGLHDFVNVVLTCPDCNMRKHDKTEEEFNKTLGQAA